MVFVVVLLLLTTKVGGYFSVHFSGHHQSTFSVA